MMTLFDDQDVKSTGEDSVQTMLGGIGGMIMPGELHEDIVDDVLFCFPELCNLTNEKVGCIAEAAIANLMLGLVEVRLVADCYLLLQDGYGAMPVEVGNMKDGKWEHIKAPDGLPVRVLRIGFDHQCWLLNPRNTELEKLVFSFVQFRLTPVVSDAASPPSGGEQTRTSGQAGEGSAPHPPRA